MLIRRPFIAISLSLIGVIALQSAALGAVGRTAGNYTVSQTGAASYTLPIWAPPGPNGLQPSIALVYNSQSGNGYVGVGWSVAGLSSIYRCNRTYAQDGAPAPVSLSTSDGYCLDGQRLRLTTGTYGVAGSTYQTEIANFQNVTAYGSAGNGPGYFIVQTPDGRKLQYGNGGGSQILAGNTGTALAWMLNQVSDAAGNTMTISYYTDTGTAVPYMISWTPTSYGVNAYSYTMVFGYPGSGGSGSGSGNPLPVSGYVAGTQIQNPSLLNSITINYNSSQIKQYILTYQQSGTGRELLTQVQECAASTGDCLLPTTITYQGGGTGVSSTASVGIGSPLYPCLSGPGPGTGSVARYDFNGDGYADLLVLQGSSCAIAFGSATGYGSPANIGFSYSGRLLVGDVLGTGKAGFLADQGGTWYYYTWNGTSFTGVSTGLAYDSTATQFAFADINGDGRPDLVTLYGPNPGTTVTTRLNTSSGGSPSFSASAVATSLQNGDLSARLIGPDDQGGNLQFFDFNGDGLQDLAVEEVGCQGYYMGYCVQAAYEVEELTSHTNGTFTLTGVNTAFPAEAQDPSVFFANVNNDACTDGILSDGTIRISACNGTPAASLSGTYHVLTVMDWNGDGLADLVESAPGGIVVQLSTGTGFGAPISTGLSYSAACTYLTLDATGDGLDDLGCWSSQSGTNGFVFNLHNGAGQSPDLLTSITDGYGNFARPSYSSMVRAANTYYTPWNDAQYPYQNMIAPMYLVTNTTYSDASNSGGSYLVWHYYAGAWTNLQGRGFAGFGSHQTYDTRNAVWATALYGRAFPYTGLPIADTATLNNNSSTTLFSTTGTPANTTLAGTDCLSTTPDTTRRCFPYISSATRQDYDVSGPRAWQLITTTNSRYTYDSYGNATNIADTVTDNDPGSPYSGQQWSTTTATSITADTGSNWCLRQPTQILITKTAPASSVTRTTTFSADYTHCRAYSQTTEPNSAAYALTQTFGYDSFGNVADLTVTGIGILSRNTHTDFGTTGQFPMYVRNPLSQITTNTYDFGFGFRTSSIDPNLISTSWMDDNFGRKVREMRPDGTYTVWSYNDCASSGGCLIGSHSLALLQTVYNSNGSTQIDGTTWFDSVDRPLIVNNRLLAAGAYARNEVRYDSLGRVVQRAMPCNWSAISAACPYWTTGSYDVLGRITQTQRPVSAQDNSMQTTTVQYVGRTITTTDPQGISNAKILTVVGAMGRSTDNGGYSQNFTYDAFGSLLSVSDSLSNTLFTADYDYGIAAFQRNATDMDLDSSTAPGHHRQFDYDALGELTRWSDANLTAHNQSGSQSYDLLSRPTVRTEPDLTTTWTWGTGTINSQAAYNIGKLQSVSANSYSESYTYDSSGRLASQSVTIPSDGTYEYDQTYNATTGLLDTLTYPVSTSSYRLKLQYGYQNGVLRTVSDFNSGTVYWAAGAVDARGQVTQETLGNGVLTTRSIDPVTGWPSAVTSGLNGSFTLQNNTYLFDKVGNLTQRQNNNVGLTESFYYDGLYRLDHSTLGSAVNLQMHYDATGNITSRTDLSAGANWSYDPQRKHAVTQAGSAAYTYTYDANGNATSRNGYAITWTSFNHPLVINGAGESVQFAYTQDHTRWSAVYSGSTGVATTYFVGSLLEKEITAGSNDYRHYIYAGNTKVAILSRASNGTNTIHYIREDHLGGVDGILNSDGSCYAKESFTAFGARRNACTWSGPPTAGSLQSINAVTRHAFTWQTALGAMGLNDMNGRIEDAVTGRFLSPDPTVPHPGFTQSLNRYSYVYNNPLTYVDPSGFEPSCFPTWAYLGGMPFWNGKYYQGDDGQWYQESEVPLTYVQSEFCFQLHYAGPAGNGNQDTGGGGGAGGGGNNGDSGGDNDKQSMQQGNLETVTVTAQIPCSAANSVGQGVLIQMGFTDAHSSGAAIPNANHIVVLAVNPTTGAVYASRGGPGSGAGGGAGSGSFSFVANSGTFAQGFPDYGSLTGVQTVGYVNASFSQVTGYFNSFAATTNANNLTYLGPVQNSNSYAGALVAGLGFPSVTPDVTAPGYGTNSPSPQLQCTKP